MILVLLFDLKVLTKPAATAVGTFKSRSRHRLLNPLGEPLVIDFEASRAHYAASETRAGLQCELLFRNIVHFSARRVKAMRLYVFKSETMKELRAFAGDPAGSRLPEKHGPWTVTGVVAAGNAPPHNLSREAIEEAIEVEGFQLWRVRNKKPECH